MKPLPHGIYEALLDEYLRDTLAQHPELRTVFGKIDPEEQPARYATFVAKVLEQALREESDPEKRLALCNHMLGHVAGEPGRGHLEKHRLIQSKNRSFWKLPRRNYGTSGIPRPHTPLAESSLFTGSPQEPQLAHELLEEMRSADGVDILVSFIKWSGLRLLMPAFEDLRDRRCAGAADHHLLHGGFRCPGSGVAGQDCRTSRSASPTIPSGPDCMPRPTTFKRNSGFSTAYIGSANMSHAAMTSGLEWNLKVTAQDMGHILEKFTAEFETYWNSREFIPFDPEQPTLFRTAIDRAAILSTTGPAVFFDLRPHPFQERILEALERERDSHDRWRNLVIAATGTGKTVVAAFDFKRFFEQKQKQARLLFVAHRQEILQQAQATFTQCAPRPEFR